MHIERPSRLVRRCLVIIITLVLCLTFFTPVQTQGGQWGNAGWSQGMKLAHAGSLIDSDYYQGFVNANGTLRFINRNTGTTILDNSPVPYFDYGSVLPPGNDLASTVTVSGDNVTVTSTDDSSADVTINNKYELNIHSPSIKYTATLTYKRDVTVTQERFDFIVPTKSASVMNRDLQLTAFEVTTEYYSDLYTPKVVKFDNGLSFMGNDSMQSMALRSHDATSSEVRFYADYSLNHPHQYFVKDAGEEQVDVSAQHRLAGQSYSAYVTLSIDPGVLLRSLVKARQPDGYDAVVVLSNHPDDETLPALNAVAYGTEDTSSPVYGTKGIMGRGFGWTKGVFVSGQTGADLDDPTYKALTDRMSDAGAEIVGHSITPVTDNRTTVSSGLQTLSQYGARNWIDHGGAYLNYEDLASQGALKGDENYILDIMDANDYDLAWAYVDLPLVRNRPNMLAPRFKSWITPFFFYNSNVDDNTADNKRTYLWSTVCTFKVTDLVYTTARVDNLISERGVCIAHDYVAEWRNENHTWYVNPNTNKREIYPDFDNGLAYMQAKREAGLLWTPTMATFGDYLLLLPSVSIVTNADGTYTIANNNAVPVDGLTLLSESDIASVRMDGAELTTFGGRFGSREIVIPSIDAGHSFKLAVSYAATSNDPPVVSDIPGETIAEGGSFDIIILDEHVADPDNADAEMSWNYSGNSALSVSISGRVATITAPNADWNGTETIVFAVTDPGLLSDNDGATFTVTAVNDPPLVSDIPDQTIAEGGRFATIILDQYVTDPDNTDSQMTWTYGGNTGLSVAIAGRVATITRPNAGWSGAETITFTATDPGLLSGSNNATFKVTAADRPPVVSDIPDQAIAEGGHFATIILDQYVTDPDNTGSQMTWTYGGNIELSVSIVGRVATITTPNGGWSGAETITFTATDPGLLSDGDQATLSVTPSPQKLAVFRPGGTWFFDASRNGAYSATADLHAGLFGKSPGDIPVAVDWEGDGRQELAVFRPGGTWFVDTNHSGVFDGPAVDVQTGLFGKSLGDIPVAIDWEGDGRQELAVFRPGGTWFIDTNHSGVFDGPAVDVQMGLFGKSPGDIPVAIDWEGDGRQELAIFRPGGTWFIDTNRNGVYDGPTVDYTNSPGTFGGQTDDIPLAIDWDGDGRQELAIFRPGGTWFVDLNHNGVFDPGNDLSVGPFGQQAGDTPLAIDWNGG